MEVQVGEPIQLDARAGSFLLRHVRSGSLEGVCIVGLRETRQSDPIPVRVQSSCLFSESFWAIDCDCALQLRAALEIVTKEGGSILYFYEEGRGAGLEMKIEAIRLQQLDGLSTDKAYKTLDLALDERSFKAVGPVLQHLFGPGRRYRLLTNNPYKVEKIRQTGVNIARVEGLVVGMDDPRIRPYLVDKTRFLGHDITFKDDDHDST